MNTYLSVLIMLAAAAQGPSDNAVVQSTLTVQQPVQQVRGTGVSMSAPDYMFDGQSLWDQARGAVLVVPAPGLPVEGVAELTEDLTVMCRIFDKALPATSSGVVSGYGGRGGRYSYVVAGHTAGTQGLYLDGYGALFFVDVDYPLVPPEQQEPAEARPQESGDPVWSQTIDEMTGRRTGADQGGRALPVYDAQRVESLKKTLIKMLGHAANIRTRGPQDSITVVVGSLDGAGTTYRAGGRGGSGMSGGTTARAGAAGGVTPQGAALMVLRVAKSDADAFSKGQLTLAQFTEKIQTAWSWPTWNTVPEEKRGPTVPSSGSSRR